LPGPSVWIFFDFVLFVLLLDFFKPLFFALELPEKMVPCAWSTLTESISLTPVWSVVLNVMSRVFPSLVMVR
jgi:hypothetical protein